MRSRVPLLAIAVLLLIPSAAFGSLAGEQRQGHRLIGQLQAGTKTCHQLSSEDFDHIGEYVMFRALGSAKLHQAMNNRMSAMMGAQGESRMHQLLGQRYTGCHTSSAAQGYGWMGPGMMGGYYGNNGLGGMMHSDWSWMTGGWQSMTRQDWRRVEQRLLGPRTVATSGGGWGAAAIVAVTLGGVLILALTVLAVIRLASKRPPSGPKPEPAARS